MDGGAGGLRANRLPVVLRSVGAVPSRRGRVPRLSCRGVLPATVQPVWRTCRLPADQCLPAGQLERAAGRAANATQSELLRIGAQVRTLRPWWRSYHARRSRSQCLKACRATSNATAPASRVPDSTPGDVAPRLAACTQ